MENARLERGLSPSPLLLDNPGVEIIARYVPSRENTLLGGDFYDFVQTPDRTVHVMIGDVAGHGPDEAALGVALRIAWRALTFAGLRGPDRMRELERILHTERAGKGIFATVLSLAIPPEGSQIRAVRAGHPGMLLHGEGTVDWLEPPGGPALGLHSGEWEYHQVEWPEGTALVLLTDGLFEGHSGRGNERLGEEGLLELARSHAALPGPEFVDALINEAAQRRASARRTDRRHRGGPRGARKTRIERPALVRRLTVQGWQNLVLSAMGVVVLAGLVAGGLLMNRTDHMARELIDNIQPARVAAYQLQAALRDQETAVRGYVITADRQFLDPYYAGQQVEKQAADDIRELVGTRPELMTDLDAIEQGAASWRTSYAEPLIADVSRGVPATAGRDRTERGKAEFDHLRRLFDRQNENLGTARTDGISELDRMRHWRDGLAIAMVVAFVAMALVLALLVRGAVTRPLAALAAACRRITEGNFGEQIVPRGPRDIRAIAADVEDMRQRIVDELDASRSARAALDEQAEELRRSNAELEQFAYVASHDLQEPLRKVASFCQLLEKRYGDQLDERGAEYIGFAVDGAKRMQALINDLLTFSRVGRLNATHTEVDLDAALDTALDNLSTAIEESGAEIVRPDQPLPTVDGDPDAADDGVAEPHRQRGEVPARGSRAADRHRLRTAAAALTKANGSSASPTTASASPRSSPTRSSSSSNVCTAVTCTAERASVWHCARRSSSTTADPSGSTRPTPREPDSCSHCPLPPPPSQTRSQRPFWKEHTSDISRTRAIDVLLIEDDPGDELITREAFEHNKINNTFMSPTTARKAWTSSTSAVPTRTPRGPT